LGGGKKLLTKKAFQRGKLLRAPCIMVKWQTWENRRIKDAPHEACPRKRRPAGMISNTTIERKERGRGRSLYRMDCEGRGRGDARWYLRKWTVPELQRARQRCILNIGEGNWEGGVDRLPITRIDPTIAQREGNTEIMVMGCLGAGGL